MGGKGGGGVLTGSFIRSGSLRRDLVVRWYRVEQATWERELSIENSWGVWPVAHSVRHACNTYVHTDEI